MPLYEYKCQSCGKTFEVLQKFADEPLKTHPECGGPVERLISPPAIQFKGSGWYVTDYGKGSNGKSSREDTRTEAKKEKKSESSAESKSESKPAASTETKTSPGN